MKITVQFWAILAFAVALSGQEKPKDVDGWGKVKWGMTIAEVRAAYHTDAPTQTNSGGKWSSLPLGPIQIGSIEMSSAAFTKRDSDRIGGVSMSSGFGSDSDPKSSGPSDFDTLKTQLIQKYGAPASVESTHENDSRVKTAIWTFPSTSIDLTLIWLDTSAGIQNIGTILLRYTATDKKALDKL